ncbi:MAG: cupredoxin domain-containing protein [Thermodesulfobacteriota bacterium]
MSFIQLLLLGAIAGFTIFLGLPVAIFTTRSRLRAFLSSLSVGVLIFLLIEIAYKSLEIVEEAMKSGFLGAGLSRPLLLLGILVAGLSAGLLGLTLFEERFKKLKKADTPEAHSKRISLMIAIGIGLHNFSEGLVIGQQFATGAISLAILLIVGFALHNATEGFGIAAPLKSRKVDWGFLAIAGFIGGAPTFFGTIVGSFVISTTMELLFLTLAAGSILYIVGELMHLGKLHGQHRTAMIGLLVGFFLAYGSELVIEVGSAVSANRQQASRTFAVEVSEFEFIPSTFRVIEGETVRFNVENTGKVPHEFKVKKLGVEFVIPEGKSAAITVSAPRSGVYDLICDLPGHLKAGMRGELIVSRK